jgi:class 3 adenylate cyclase
MRQLLVRTGFAFEDPQDEASFLDRYVLRHRLAIQLLGLLLGLVMFGYTLLDQLLDPASAHDSRLYRGLTLGFIVAMAALVGLPAMRRWLELVMTATIAVLVGGVVLAVVAVDRDFGLWGLLLVTLIAAHSSLFPMRLGYFLLGVVVYLAAVAVVTAHVPPGPKTYFNTVTVVTSVAIGLAAVMRRELVARREWRLMREVEAARGRIEDLLHTMLPADVARRIQAGAPTVADVHPEVAIVFADLVGFTDLSRRITAAQLVELLNSVFSAFDRLAERHGLERIKTIGDCYMATSGLAPGSGDVARAAADFALALPAIAAEASRAAGHPLDARVGLHVGPVVAGVIGVQRPAFDCWGASVNLASRLETAAAPGGILISEDAWRRLGPEYVVTSLAAQDLKGFGPTPVYRLEARTV